MCNNTGQSEASKFTQGTRILLVFFPALYFLIDGAILVPQLRDLANESHHTHIPKLIHLTLTQESRKRIKSPAQKMLKNKKNHLEISLQTDKNKRDYVHPSPPQPRLRDPFMARKGP